MRLKPWKDLRITDDYMFKLVMSHPRLCKHLIECVLGIKIREIKYIEEEKSVKNTYGSKGIRLDVYVEDEAKSRFLLEMQVESYSDRELARRSRYYQSTIDFDFLHPGGKYRDLGDAYVIFFCPCRLFDGARRMYTIKDVCIEDKSIMLDDGMTKVFLSSQGRPTDDLNTDVAAFLEYMNGKLPANSFVEEIDAEVSETKRNRGKEADYMTWQMIIDEERDEALLEGMRRVALSQIKRRARKGLPFDEEFITELSEDTGLPRQMLEEMARGSR